MKAFYDVIALGPGLAAPAAAALLARAGYRVLLLRGPEAEPDAAPRVVAGLDAPAWVALADTLALTAPLRRLVKPYDPAWQVLGPRLRLDVPADDALLARELAREVPVEAEGALRFFGRTTELRGTLDGAFTAQAPLWPRGLWSRARGRFRRTGLEALEGSVAVELLAAAVAAGASGSGAAPGVQETPPPVSPLLQALALAPVRFAARLIPPEGAWPPAVAAARAVDALRRDPVTVDGGPAAIAALLAGAAARHGAEVRAGAAGTAQEIVHRAARAEGVRVVASPEVLGASLVLAACDLEAVATLCPGRAGHARHLRAREAMAPAERVLSLGLRLDDAALPAALGPLAYAVRDPDAALVEENLLQLERLPADARGTARLVVSCLAPAARAADVEARAALRTRVLGALDDACPFAARHVRADVGPLDLDGAAVFRAAAPPPHGALGPAPDSGLDDVLAAGPELAPGLGVEGEALAAWSLVGRVRDRLGGRVVEGRFKP
ncbi:MAG TPA: hypothetical protein VG389_25625 [Myxococcota bacterium]|nr:hypothetical protein [Myxococcota bacterium]